MEEEGERKIVKVTTQTRRTGPKFENVSKRPSDEYEDQIKGIFLEFIQIPVEKIQQRTPTSRPVDLDEFGKFLEGSVWNAKEKDILRKLPDAQKELVMKFDIYNLASYPPGVFVDAMKVSQYSEGESEGEYEEECEEELEDALRDLVKKMKRYFRTKTFELASKLPDDEDTEIETLIRDEFLSFIQLDLKGSQKEEAQEVGEEFERFLQNSSIWNDEEKRIIVSLPDSKKKLVMKFDIFNLVSFPPEVFLGVIKREKIHEIWNNTKSRGLKMSERINKKVFSELQDQFKGDYDDSMIERALEIFKKDIFGQEEAPSDVKSKETPRTNEPEVRKYCNTVESVNDLWLLRKKHPEEDIIKFLVKKRISPRVKQFSSLVDGEFVSKEMIDKLEEERIPRLVEWFCFQDVTVLKYPVDYEETEYFDAISLIVQKNIVVVVGGFTLLFPKGGACNIHEIFEDKKISADFFDGESLENPFVSVEVEEYIPNESVSWLIQYDGGEAKLKWSSNFCVYLSSPSKSGRTSESILEKKGVLTEHIDTFMKEFPICKIESVHFCRSTVLSDKGGGVRYFSSNDDEPNTLENDVVFAVFEEEIKKDFYSLIKVPCAFQISDSKFASLFVQGKFDDKEIVSLLFYVPEFLVQVFKAYVLDKGVLRKFKKKKKKKVVAAKRSKRKKKPKRRKTKDSEEVQRVNLFRCVKRITKWVLDFLKKKGIPRNW